MVTKLTYLPKLWNKTDWNFYVAEQEQESYSSYLET